MAFEAALRELALGRPTRALRRTVPGCEIAVGGWLLSGFAGPAAAASAVVLVVVFSAAIIRLATSGRYAGCGCFGEALGADQAPVVALARNAGLTSVGVALLVVPGSGPLSRGELVGALTASFGLFLAWCCVAALIQPFAEEMS
jgi:hypothetical protein